MINIMKLKLFPMFSRAIAIPVNEDKPYNIIFMSENSNFITAYPKLNIRRQFCKRITAIPFKIPRLLSTMKNLLPYKKTLGLLPVLNPDRNNVYIDTDEFFKLLDSRYGKQSYKRPIVFQKIIEYFNAAKSYGDAKSILMYHVDLSKPVAPQFFYRRSVILALMAQVGEGALPFDNAVLAVEQNGATKFYSIYNKSQRPFSFQKIVSIVKRLIPKEKDIESDIPEEESVDLNEPDNMLFAPAKLVSDSYDQSEKASILRFIDKHQKRKVITS